MISDTDPQMETLRLQMLRQAPGWRRAEMLGQMYQTVRHLAYRGLCQRYPAADEAELRRRLADLLLGEQLAEQVYGPLFVEDLADAD